VINFSKFVFEVFILPTIILQSPICPNY